jgi:hypothetical protein
MMAIRIAIAVIGVMSAVSLTSCSDNNSAASDGTAPDVEAYKQLNEQLLSTVDTHCRNAASMSGMMGCTTELNRYDSEAVALINDMSGQSVDMDNCMMDMGRQSLADMAQTCNQMSEELSNYMNSACSSNDISKDISAADHHCQVMRDMVNQELDRANMMEQSDGMMASGSGMMSGSGMGVCGD